MHALNNQKGIALVVTLLALVLITAMVVEFSYGVYTGTNNLYNWRDSQRLSIMAKSGINVTAKYLKTMPKDKFTEPVELPVENPFEDFKGVIAVRIEDENAKFNINAIVYKTGDPNPGAYHAFQKLLQILSLDKKIADRVKDWIDPDGIAELSGSEAGAKNSALASVDELLSINGITRRDYDKLLPYITVYGTTDNLVININGAEAPVLMSLSDSIDEGDAKKIMKQREGTPFSVAPFETETGISVIFKGVNFSMRSSAESGGVKRIIETVLDTEKQKIEYWKEY